MNRGVVGLAIGFILGGAVGKVVTSLVSDIITPLLGLVLGTAGNLNDAYVKIGNSRLMWGSFVNNVIDFIIIALVVYYGFKLLRLEKLDKVKNSK